VEYSPVRWWRSRWLRVFLAGLVLYVFCQAVLPDTSYNAAFIVGELVIGSLLVPVAFVLYFYERGTLRQTPTDVIVTTFVLGAVLGGSAAAILENAIHLNGYWGYLPVGFIEEGAKAAVVIWWLRRRDLTSPDTGSIIGAATGMGFAVLETMGYAFASLFLALGTGASAVTAMVAELNVRGAL